MTMVHVVERGMVKGMGQGNGSRERVVIEQWSLRFCCGNRKGHGLEFWSWWEDILESSRIKKRWWTGRQEPQVVVIKKYLGPPTL